MTWEYRISPPFDGNYKNYKPTPDEVKQLREDTGISMMDCIRLLRHLGPDLDTICEYVRNYKPKPLPK